MSKEDIYDSSSFCHCCLGSGKEVLKIDGRTRPRTLKQVEHLNKIRKSRWVVNIIQSVPEEKVFRPIQVFATRDEFVKPTNEFVKPEEEFVKPTNEFVKHRTVLDTPEPFYESDFDSLL